jgi:hypothetical protein
MFLSLYDLEKRIGFFDGAIRCGIQVVHESTTWVAGAAVLKELTDLVGKALAAPSDRPHAISDGELFEFQRRLAVQTRIWQLFASQKKPFDKNLSLLGPRASSMLLAAELLIDLQVGYLQEVCDLSGIQRDRVCDAAIDVLATPRRKGIVGFFRDAGHLDGNAYVTIIGTMALSVHKRAADPASFVPFVRANVKGVDTQARILATAGYKKEALALASGNRKLVQEIDSYRGS